MPSGKPLLALLALVLAGCAHTQPPQVIRELPPAALLEDCPVPVADLATNGALVDHILSLRYALRECNNDKAALREWAKE